MIRRVVRIAVAAFCLLSLLAAAGVACLRWESQRGRGYLADASALGTYVMLESGPGAQAGVVMARGWRRAEQPRAPR